MSTFSIESVDCFYCFCFVQDLLEPKLRLQYLLVTTVSPDAQMVGDNQFSKAAEPGKDCGTLCPFELVHEDSSSVVPTRGGSPECVGDPVVFGVVTVSDRASAGVYDDASGPEILRFFQEAIISECANFRNRS